MLSFSQKSGCNVRIRFGKTDLSAWQLTDCETVTSVAKRRSKASRRSYTSIRPTIRPPIHSLTKRLLEVKMPLFLFTKHGLFNKMIWVMLVCPSWYSKCDTSLNFYRLAQIIDIDTQYQVYLAALANLEHHKSFVDWSNILSRNILMLIFKVNFNDLF